ncbi:endonuclease/exonuclease/phosphatase family protein [Kangiella sp. TOML190]|uniref:endonuclease/exonuclease/phosphatase family protein n=1 Tax=Kangiella sp. TOML190 TaxID=2931351 RepID=UPI00203F9EA7|nr:endonuclease/exonuclease/phosphatase family protein [Kangiella sp. TOML190]
MSQTSIRIVSYNIRKAVGLDWKRNPERILTVLAETDADIIALQEADKRFGSRQSALPVDNLKQDMNYHAVAIDNLEQSIGWHGNTVLLKNELQEINSCAITLPGLEPRGAVLTRIQLKDNKQLRIIGTHLSLAGKARQQQVAALVNYIEDSKDDTPCIIAGDFNEWRTFGKAARAFAEDFKVITPGPSFHTSNPKLPLDRFVIYGELDISDFGVHQSTLAKRASDHLPIYMDVKL